MTISADDIRLRQLHGTQSIPHRLRHGGVLHELFNPPPRGAMRAAAANDSAVNDFIREANAMPPFFRKAKVDCFCSQSMYKVWKRCCVGQSSRACVCARMWVCMRVCVRMWVCACVFWETETVCGVTVYLCAPV